MLKEIPPIRLILYTLIIGLLPFFAAMYHHFSSKKALALTKERIEQLRYDALVQEKREANNQAIIAYYRDADHFYIDKQLETMTPLQQEIESLEKVVKKENYPGDDAIQKRLEYLTGASNQIIFTEGTVQSHPLYQETTETLSHPVEVSSQDIKTLLARIEGVEIDSNKVVENRPQLLILDFKVERKQQTENMEVFVLNLKLLKREYL